MVMLPNDLTESSFVQDFREAITGQRDTVPGWAHSFFGSHWEFEDLMRQLEEYVEHKFGRPSTAGCSDDLYAHLMPGQSLEVWNIVVLQKGECCAACVQQHQERQLDS